MSVTLHIVCRVTLIVYPWIFYPLRPPSQFFRLRCCPCPIRWGVCLCVYIYIYIYEWIIIGWGNSATSHYLNQSWLIVNCTIRNKFQLKVNQNRTMFCQENAFQNIVCNMAATLFWPQSMNWKNRGKYITTEITITLLWYKCHKFSTDNIMIQTLSALLVLCGGIQNHKGSITQSFDVFFVVILNKLLNKESNYRWFETP